MLPVTGRGQGTSRQDPASQSPVLSEFVAPKPIYIPDTPANRKLHNAVTWGNVAAVKAALRDGANPEVIVCLYGEKDPGIPLVLFDQAQTNHYDPDRFLTIFRLLVERVKNVNLSEKTRGRTLLMQAVAVGDLSLVKSLVERGAAVDAVTKVQKWNNQTSCSETALQQSVQRDADSGEDPDPIAVYLILHGADVNHVCAGGGTTLMRAAQYKKVETVRLLLAKGADPSVRDKGDYTALRYASLRGADDVIALLEKRTPMNLWEAASFGNAARVKELLAAGANPNENRPIPDSLGMMHGDKRVGETPLAVAMQSNDPLIVQTLINAGANVRYVHPRSGKTALHTAATYNSIAVIPLLIAQGADVNALAVRRDANDEQEASQYNAVPPQAYNTASPDKSLTATPPAERVRWLVDTPLVCAVEAANAEAVLLLLRNGVKMAAHDQGNTAFLRLMRNSGREPRRPREQKINRVKKGDAATDAQDVILEALVKAGADVEKTGAVALAVQQGQPGVVEYLLEQGASPNAHATGTVGDETALMSAIEQTRANRSNRERFRKGTRSGPDEEEIAGAERTTRESMALLLKAGADVNEAARGTGVTLLMKAVEYGLYVIADDLMKRGANLEATDTHGRTALLRLAGEGRNIAGVRWLLQKGANPNRADNSGYTALLLAVDNGASTEWEQYQKTLAPDTKDESQRLPIIYSAAPHEDKRPKQYSHPEMVALLLESGADITVVAKDGKTTAFTLAKKNGFNNVEALLLSNKGSRMKQWFH